MSEEATLQSLIPDPKVLLALEPEELAGPLLEVLISLEGQSYGLLNKYALTEFDLVLGFPEDLKREIQKALLEAWGWLEREGLAAVFAFPGGDAYFVTRRGHQVENKTGLDSYRKSNLLPKQLLHPTIAQKVWSLFLRGEYDTAVFQAFKDVEVAVREAAGFSANEVGVSLMRAAFHPDSGPLTDSNVPTAEREAMQHLFAGAIGLYKNPHSHRNVSIDAPRAVEMIILASHLLDIVESRRPKSS